MKRYLIKWLLVAMFASYCLLSVHAQPTHIEKRQDEGELNELHHTTLTRTATKTETKMEATATSTPKETHHSSNDSYNIIPVNTPEWNIAVYGTESGISSRMGALGGVLIALGIFLCSFGFRLSKIMLCVMGLLTFGSMTWIALANLRPESGYSRDEITMIVVPVGVGVVGAIVYYVLWNIALYLVGAFGGFVFAVFICSWKSNFVIEHLIGRYCFIGGMALAFAILIWAALRPALFFTTSFVGAYIIMFGIDCLARTGFIAGPQALLNRNPRHMIEYRLSTTIYVLLAMVIAAFLFSLVWQLIFNAAYELALHVTAAVKGKEAHDDFHQNREAVIEDDHVSTAAAPHPESHHVAASIHPSQHAAPSIHPSQHHRD
ncbi:hypothetical protein BD560DRAFT_404258 [Blakeslea trispora]|nr:hypothetical protein BD560DRAFT_404258 [Blakeslea trispora]